MRLVEIYRQELQLLSESAEQELEKFKVKPPKPSDVEHQAWAMINLMGQSIKKVSQHTGETIEFIKAAMKKVETWNKFESLLEQVGPYHRLKGMM